MSKPSHLLTTTLRSFPLPLYPPSCNPRNFLEMPLFVSHVGKSMYAMQLQRWFDLFGRDNFKVCVCVYFSYRFVVKDIQGERREGEGAGGGGAACSAFRSRAVC